MVTRSLGRSGLQVAPLALGGNVFGWTADEPTSFELLDVFVGEGFNLVDTSNGYSRWAPGNKGGESETIIGNWLRLRPGIRSKVIIATKVGCDMGPGRSGLSQAHIREEVEGSLRRLRTDYIDVYQSHIDDPKTPLEETLHAYAQLVREGKVRAIGASNYPAGRLAEALQVSARHGYPRYESLQPRYNLYDRDKFESELDGLCRDEGLGVIPYFALASGFLTGKYRSEAEFGKTARGQFMNRLANVTEMFGARGQRILAALERVSAELDATPAQVSLAWLLAHRVTAPIASATSVGQLRALMRGVTMALPVSSVRLLDEASAPAA